tara:strand:+ start:1747 stop:1974 length:228 start_codon:yes stop_codon:yes gene_type:complete
MSKFENELSNLLETLIELDDIDEIEKNFSLFCYNKQLMPGSDEYELVFNYLSVALTTKMNASIINKLRVLLDEYE